ncbi:MAG: recombinase family protein [Opitutales bacterium]
MFSLHKNQHIEEQVSSRVKLDKRKLSKLLKAMKKSDVLIVSEISRLGRSLLEVMGVLNFCMQRDVKVIAIRATY